MKNLLLIVLMAFSFSMITSAHAPKKITASYDASSQTVNLEISHKVKDTKTHYIEEIVISIGEDEVITKTYTEQSSLKSHNVSIKLPKAVEKGTTIDINTKCNKLGGKKAEIVVE